MKQVSLDEIAQNEAIIFEPVFFEKDFKFNYSIDEKIIVKGNDVHLKQLLDILLDNASKYSAKNGVHGNSDGITLHIYAYVQVFNPNS